MWYINMKYKENDLETVDEHENLETALILLGEYQISDETSEFSVSNECTKECRDEDSV